MVAQGTIDHGGKWVHLRFPGSHHRLELNYYPPKSRYYRPFGPGEEFDHFGFYSPRIDDWLRLARRAGAKRALDIVEGKSRIAYFTDPDGNWLEGFGRSGGRRRRRPVRRRPRAA